MCYIFGFILTLLLSYCYRLVFCINMAHLKKFLRLCLNFLCSFTFFILIVQEKGACHLIKKKLKKKFQEHTFRFSILIFILYLSRYI